LNTQLKNDFYLGNQMSENYEKVLEWCRNILENDFKPCGLENELKKELYDLTLDWERRKEEAEREKRQIGGLMVIFHGLMKSWRQAEGLAKKYNKNVCCYLKMSLENKWLTNYCCSMWE